MKKLKKGSFTLEAALLMPLLLTVIMSMLYLDFFVHNRAWLTAAAYEAAVSGSMEGYKKEANIYETADIQGRMLGSQGLPGPEYADKCGKKCAGNLSYGDTGRVSRTKMEYYSQRNSETVTSCRMDTQDKGSGRCAERGEKLK